MLGLTGRPAAIQDLILYEKIDLAYSTKTWLGKGLTASNCALQNT